MENICLDLNNLIPRLLRFGIWVTRNLFMIYLKYQMMGQVLQPRFFKKKLSGEKKKKKRKDICKRELPLLIHLFLYSFPYPSPTLQLGHVDINSTSLCWVWKRQEGVASKFRTIETACANFSLWVNNGLEH